MPDTSLPGVFDALAAQLASQLANVDVSGVEVGDLQVVGRMMLNPTPVAIDLYPATEPFQEHSGFGVQDYVANITIRCRVGPVDNEGAQDVLLTLMDPRGDSSVVRAVAYDRTLGGTVQDAVCGLASNFEPWLDPTGAVLLLGCIWPAKVTL